MRGLLVLLSLLPCLAAAGGFPLVQTLSPDAVGAEFFGGALAIDGRTLVVGAPAAKDAGFNSGAAYVFELQSGAWVQTARLTASDAAAFDHFGVRVAVAQGTIMVTTGRGWVQPIQRDRLFIYEKSGEGWTEVQKFTASAAERNAFFGKISMAGNRAAVGTPEGIQVLRRGNGAWLEESLVPRVGLIGIHRRSLVAFRYDRSVPRSAVTHFRRRSNRWIEFDTIEAPAGQCGWGHATSRARKLLAVTEKPGAVCLEEQPGEAYIYQRSGGQWRLESVVGPTIAASSGVDVQFFGREVVLGNSLLLVKAHDGVAGTVYVFQRSRGQWLEQAKLETRRGNQTFGGALAVGDEHFFVGVPGRRPGEVLVYSMDGS